MGIFGQSSPFDADVGKFSFPSATFLCLSLFLFFGFAFLLCVFARTITNPIGHSKQSYYCFALLSLLYETLTLFILSIAKRSENTQGKQRKWNRTRTRVGHMRRAQSGCCAAAAAAASVHWTSLKLFLLSLTLRARDPPQPPQQTSSRRRFLCIP